MTEPSIKDHPDFKRCDSCIVRKKVAPSAPAVQREWTVSKVCLYCGESINDAAIPCRKTLGGAHSYFTLPVARERAKQRALDAADVDLEAVQRQFASPPSPVAPAPVTEPQEGRCKFIMGPSGRCSKCDLYWSDRIHDTPPKVAAPPSPLATGETPDNDMNDHAFMMKYVNQSAPSTPAVSPGTCEAMRRDPGADDRYLFTDRMGDVWRLRVTYSPNHPFIFELVSRAFAPKETHDEPTKAQMSCGFALYGPPALCTCGTCPAPKET